MRWISQNLYSTVIRLCIICLLFMLPVPTGAINAKAPDGSPLAILHPEDAVPADAVKIRELSLGGTSYDGDCAYFELLIQATSLAREAGANMLKIKSRIKHSRSQRCDRLEVAFYQAPAPRKAEQTFSWDAGRKLTWEDFTGPVRAGSGERTAAETNCGIAVETNMVVNGGKARVYVFNTFDKRNSWVKTDMALPAVLEHEQGHWDICEIYTRKMQARFDATEITGATLSRKVNEIYNAVSAEYIRRQEQYERETQHGVVREEQQRWTKLLAEELGLQMTGRL